MKNVLGIIFSFIMLAIGLGGCTMSGVMSSVVTAVGDANKNNKALVFDLSAPSRFSIRRRNRNVVLTVYKPTALKNLEHASILVRTSQNEIAVLPNVKWVDKLPRLVQARLIQSFENVRAVGSVSNGRDQINNNYSLQVNIRAFQMNARGKSSADAVVNLYVKLIHKNTGKVIGQKNFKSSSSVRLDETGRASAAGLNHSFQVVARNIVRWVARKNIEADYVN